VETAIDEFEQARRKTLNDYQEHGVGYKLLYPSDRTIQNGLGRGHIDIEENTTGNDYDGFITTPHSPSPNSTLTSLVYTGRYILYNGQQYLPAPVAVKAIAMTKYVEGFGDEDQVKTRFEREAALCHALSQQDHPNILPFYGDFQETQANESSNHSSGSQQDHIYLVTPWANQGDTRKYLQVKSNREQHAPKLVGDVISGLAFLHSDQSYLTTEPKKSVKHGDLHPGNIFIHQPVEGPGKGKPLAWIADFGLSTDNEEAATFPTHRHFCAPELRDEEYDSRPYHTLNETEKNTYKTNRQILGAMMEKADVYSFGWVALFILTGKESRSVVEASRQALLDELTPPSTQVTLELFTLIRKCCDQKPSERPTMAEVKALCKEHNLVPLLEDANREAILQDT